MNAGVFSAVSGSLAAQTRMDALANNLANASTAGFKAERMLQKAERAGDLPPPPTAVSTPLARGSVETDFSQGSINHSGNPLDIALSGDGFLVVKTDQGERLTRSGNLAIDREGYLAAADGSRIQGTSGDIRIPEGPVVIGTDGSIRAGEQKVGDLRLVTVPEPTQLIRENGTRFAPGSQALTDVAPGSVQVLQGAVEGANVTPVEGLVALIETVRGFETYMRAVERLDQVTARAVSDVGRVA